MSIALLAAVSMDSRLSRAAETSPVLDRESQSLMSSRSPSANARAPAQREDIELNKVCSCQPGHHAGPDAAPPRGCLLLVDRHVQKTGGTSLRDVLRVAEGQGLCKFWGYHQSEAGWREAIAYIERYMRATADEDVDLRLCIEVHTERFAGGRQEIARGLNARRMDAVHRLRAELEGRCRVLSTIRVRDPFGFYVSYFRWAVAGMYFVTGTGCANCSSTDFFLRFVSRFRNLQLSSLVEGHQAQDLMQCSPQQPRWCFWCDDPALCGAAPIVPDGEDLALGLKALSQADMVAPLPALRHQLQHIADIVGLAAGHHMHHRPVPLRDQPRRQVSPEPGPHVGDNKARTIAANARVVPLEAPCQSPEEEAACRSAVSRSAQLDAQLHVYGLERHQAFMSSQVGTGFEERVDALEHVRGLWFGGPPPAAKCEFFREPGDPEAHAQGPDQHSGPCSPIPTGLLRILDEDHCNTTRSTKPCRRTHVRTCSRDARRRTPLNNDHPLPVVWEHRTNPSPASSIRPRAVSETESDLFWTQSGGAASSTARMEAAETCEAAAD